MDSNDGRQRATLQRIAHRAMLERGLEPDFSPAVLAQVASVQAAAPRSNGARDRELVEVHRVVVVDRAPRESAQVARRTDGGAVQVLVAVADVDALVGKGSPVDA